MNRDTSKAHPIGCALEWSVHGLSNLAGFQCCRLKSFDCAKLAVVGLGYSIGGEGVLGSNNGDKQRFTENRLREQDILPRRSCARAAASDGKLSLRALCRDEWGRKFFPGTSAVKQSGLVVSPHPDSAPSILRPIAAAGGAAGPTLASGGWGCLLRKRRLPQAD